MMNSTSFTRPGFIEPVRLFKQICEIKINQTSPICDLVSGLFIILYCINYLNVWSLKMVRLENWQPVSSLVSSEYANYGRVMSEVSILGRFFRLSPFAEDDPKVVENFFSMASGVQMSPEILNMVGKQIHPLQASVKVWSKIIQKLFFKDFWDFYNFRRS